MQVHARSFFSDGIPEFLIPHEKIPVWINYLKDEQFHLTTPHRPTSVRVSTLDDQRSINIMACRTLRPLDARSMFSMKVRGFDTHACMHPDTSRNGQYCFPKINKIAACMHAQTNHRNLVCPIIATDFAKGWTFGAPTMDSLHIRVGRVRRLTSGIAAPCWLVGPAEPMHLQDPDCDWAREATHFALGLQPFCIMNIILDIAHTACEWHYKNKC